VWKRGVTLGAIDRRGATLLKNALTSVNYTYFTGFGNSLLYFESLPVLNKST
jgi:hypothetical protein